jgi:hypothetical protein
VRAPVSALTPLARVPFAVPQPLARPEGYNVITGLSRPSRRPTEGVVWGDSLVDDKHYDTTTPFLAICGDRTEDGTGYHDKTNSVYLINPTDVNLENVETETGGWYSDVEDGVITADGGPPEKWGTLGARSYVRIEATDDAEFDEFVIWWKISFDVNGERKNLQFSTFKGTDFTGCQQIPMLGKGGRLVKRSAHPA